MKTIHGILFVVLAGTACSNYASANAASDCRQEALEYGIAEEQLEEYVDGCLASRGELMVDNGVDISADYTPPVEPEPTESEPYASVV